IAAAICYWPPRLLSILVKKGTQIQEKLLFLLCATILVTTGQTLAIPTAPVTDELSITAFAYHEVLDDNYHLYWNTNGSHIVFKTEVKTNGYIGFGISPNGAMAKSDVVIGWVKDGQSHFADRHAEGNFVPAVDTNQDWILLSATEIGEFTTLTFMRKLVTCDPQDLSISNGTTRVIYSYTPTDPSSDSTVGYHGPTRRGTKSVLLLDPPTSEKNGKPLPDDVTTIDFFNKNVSLPAKDTYYRCTMWKLPPLAQKHHMIRYEPVIQPGHEQLVHHILLYYCPANIDDKFVGTSFMCYDETPTELQDCDSVFISWAVGGRIFNYPDVAGYSLGAPNDPIYLRMETHYNNPSLQSDIVDSSGLRIYLTKQLRQYDAGQIEVGVSVDAYQVIPPYEKSFISSGYCTQDCIGKTLGDQEIRVFANFLHSHLLGRKIRTRHIRNGVELPPILEDNAYDFNYQETRILTEERVVKKGDLLLVECDYDSTQRTQITHGGLKTTLEMCLSFLLYYPKAALTRCLTNIDYKIPDQYKDQDFFSIIYSLDWTNPIVREAFKKDIEESGINDFCFLDNKPPVRS
ncbi:unnamed protein product, partial [Lymnaea stagnalis]